MPVLLAVWCSPDIDEVFTQQRLSAVGTPGSNLLGKAGGVVGRCLVQVETGIGDGTSTGSAHKMCGMPGAAQRCKVTALDRLSTALTDRLW